MKRPWYWPICFGVLLCIGCAEYGFRLGPYDYDRAYGFVIMYGSWAKRRRWTFWSRELAMEQI